MSEQTKENKEKDQFILLAPYLVEHYWSDIRELLKKTNDNMMTVDDIEDNLQGFDIWVYLRGNKIHYALVAEQIGKDYFISRIGGGSKLFPWDLMYNNLSQWARYLECTTITGLGEKYWADKVGHLGFKIVQYVFSAPVKEIEDAE